MASFLGISALLVGRGQSRPTVQLLAVGMFAGGCLLVFLAEYVTWTPLDSQYVEGVHGRYFLGLLPLLAFMTLGLPKAHPRLLDLWRIAQCLVLVVTSVLTISTVVSRYYLP